MRQKASAQTRICILVTEFVCFCLAAALIGICSYYNSNFYNTLTCNVSSVTPVESTTHQGSISWFFQYSFKGASCTYSDTYTVYSNDYDSAFEQHANYLSKKTRTCYAVKGADQCVVSIDPPKAGDFWIGTIFGILLLFVICLVIYATLSEMYTAKGKNCKACLCCWS